jgi:hypothetical protein
MKIAHYLTIIAVCLAACSTEQEQKFNAFVASSTGQAIINHVEQTSAAAADSAIQQYVNTGQVQGAQVAKDTLSSVSQQLRGLQTTGNAANPAAITQAVNDGTPAKKVRAKVAPAVSKAVTDAVQKGAPADLANEAAARGIDKAAAKSKP